MSDGKAVAVEGYVRFKKVRGKHRMFCDVRNRKVVLGKGCDDGDVAYLPPGGLPKESNESWERMDDLAHVTEATEQQVQEAAGDPEGTLAIVEAGEGAYNVVNTATGEAINTTPLTREQAEAMAAGSPVHEVEEKPEEKKGLLAKAKDTIKDALTPSENGEGGGIGCPHGFVFSQDHDEHEECDECSIADACQAKKEEENGD